MLTVLRAIENCYIGDRTPSLIPRPNCKLLASIFKVNPSGISVRQPESTALSELEAVYAKLRPSLTAFCNKS